MYTRHNAKDLRLILLAIPAFALAFACDRYLSGLWYPRDYSDLLRVGLCGVCFLIVALGLLIAESSLFPKHCCKERHHWNQRWEPRVWRVLVWCLCIGVWLGAAAIFTASMSYRDACGGWSRLPHTPDWRLNWWIGLFGAAAAIIICALSLRSGASGRAARWLSGEAKPERKKRR